MVKGDCNNCKFKNLPSNSTICVECGLSRSNYIPSTECPSYSNEKNWLGLHGVCNGTKEREPCSCDGDKERCDFYGYVRRQGRAEQTNTKRIRNMSDEELADFLAGIQFNVLETMYNVIAMKPQLRKEELAWKWLKWLGEISDDKT